MSLHSRGQAGPYLGLTPFLMASIILLCGSDRTARIIAGSIVFRSSFQFFLWKWESLRLRANLDKSYTMKQRKRTYKYLSWMSQWKRKKKRKIKYQNSELEYWEIWHASCLLHTCCHMFLSSFLRTGFMRKSEAPFKMHFIDKLTESWVDITAQPWK